MFNIELYENRHGFSEVGDYLEKLSAKSAVNKDSRIQFWQIVLFIELLK